MDLVFAPSQIETWPLDRLRPYARNAKIHGTDQVAKIAASMAKFGWTVPCMVADDGELIAGHGRVLAARKLGLTDVPCIRLAHLTETQKRAYIIADNKLALNAGWDDSMLRLEMSALDDLGFDLELTGFDDVEVAALLSESTAVGLTDPDDAPSVADAISKNGDLWVLGVHRVRCGDSTVIQDIEDLMGGLFADGCWTDPPYNVAYESKLAGKIKNDDMSDDKFRAFLTDAFVTAYAVMKPGAPIYIAHADTEGLNFRGAFKDANFKISGCLVWAKNSLVLGRSDYQWQHEPILYGWRPGAAHRWYGGRKQTTLLQLGGSIFTQNEDGTVTANIGGESIVISGENLKATIAAPTIFRCEKPKRSSEHPTMKPVDLISRMLRNSTREGDVVLDLFGGSGSTLIACEMLGRQARLCELDGRFVDVIVKRWQEFTGKQATLEADGRTFEQVAAGAETETT